MKQSKSSKRWMNEHVTDTYVKQAKEKGYRSRASFKLIELQQKYQLFKPGHTVVDLGASPGGWSQIAAKWLGQQGQMVALDLLPMLALPGVHFIQGDFTEEETYQALMQVINGRSIDVVMSDMAPNMSGIKSSDQAKAMYLCELAFDFAQQVLSPKGVFIAKVFQGEGFDSYIKQLRHYFAKVIIAKPAASRARSREYYVVAWR